MFRLAAIISLALIISGCSAGSSGAGRTAAAARPAVSTASSGSEAFRAPQVMRERELNSVIGKDASALSSRFGQARIDLVEGDARKLQFVSDGCVLDIYLYPLEANAAPVATHVEARARQGGSETDRAACIAEVERRGRS